MTVRLVPSTALLLALGATACGASPTPADPPAALDEAATAPEVQTGDAEEAWVVSFRDRQIDLEPYVQGFPWRIAALDLEHRLALATWSSPDGVLLYEVTLDPDAPLDITAGRALGDIDWSTRSFWSATYREADDAWYLWADEQNEERMNVYRLDRADGRLERITDNDYTYGWGFSRDESLLGYVSRSGDGDPWLSCLHMRDLTDGSEQTLWCDDGGADRLTWTGMEFSPDGSQVVLRTQHDGDRNRVGLGLFDATEPGEPRLLLPRDVERFSVYTLDEAFDGSSLLYVTAESGFDEVFRLDLASGASQQLTQFGRDVSSIDLVDIDGLTNIVATLQWPHQTELVVVDPEQGTERMREALPATVTMLDTWDGTLALDLDAIDIRFQVDLLSLHADGDLVSAEQHSWATLPGDLGDRIVHCSVRRVEYPTFDAGDDGQPRMLHAFYLEPMNPPQDPDDRLVVITSFYGGENYYSTTQHILCEAGIASFSPSPRGSSGFGAAFSALNDRDLGGDEIVDIIYAARWLEDHEGYAPHQIGLRGGSHGGYATMRALTFPPETNGRNESFDFGFGMSHAGFSNILTFFEASNIPDWVVLEAGDPATEADRLLDRSPISHVDLLHAPLLLTHGSNDQRVPVDESRSFAAAAEAIGAPVTYVEFEGQGHGITGLDNTLRYFRAVFAFLQQVADAQ